MEDILPVVVIGLILFLLKLAKKKPKKQEDVFEIQTKAEEIHPKKERKVSSPSFPYRHHQRNLVAKPEHSNYEMKAKKKRFILSKALMNKDSLRQAFILSEILKRKDGL